MEKWPNWPLPTLFLCGIFGQNFKSWCMSRKRRQNLKKSSFVYFVNLIVRIYTIIKTSKNHFFHFFIRITVFISFHYLLIYDKVVLFSAYSTFHIFTFCTCMRRLFFLKNSKKVIFALLFLMKKTLKIMKMLHTFVIEKMHFLTFFQKTNNRNEIKT